MNDIVSVGDNSPTSNFELVDVKAAKAFMDNYQEVCKSLLASSDYQNVKINGKPLAFKKKSAWRKIATAFNISDDILEKEIIRDENHQIISATFYVIATAPNGRHGVGSASCSIFDKISYKDVEQPSNFELRKRFNNAENDVIATAHTRAKSRAISDLVGMGETSAEEMEGVIDTPKKPAVKKKVKKTVKPKVAPKKPEPPKEEPPLKDDGAIEVEVVSDEKPSKSLKELMDEDKSIKRAIDELQEENRVVNRFAIEDRLLNLMQSGGITEDDYRAARKILG